MAQGREAQRQAGRLRDSAGAQTLINAAGEPKASERQKKTAEEWAEKGDQKVTKCFWFKGLREKIKPLLIFVLGFVFLI